MLVNLEDELFVKALPVLKQIESHGYEAYFVGGCVRDVLLHKKINDIDIASSARPEEIEDIFKVTFDVGKEHGTIVVLVNNEPYEVTTFRTEGDYSDFRRPDAVNFVRNLEEDTLRRDFTINAMAINGKGELFDYHGGMVDLNNQIIRCVGNAMERFDEDALRMMRAIRFASQLGFTIEEESYRAIFRLKDNLKHVSIERIRIEFNKFLEGSYFTDQAYLLSDSQLAEFLPGFTNELAENVMNKLAHDFRPIQVYERDIRLIWARMIMHMGIQATQDISQLLRKWTHSNTFIHDVIEIIDIFQLFDRHAINAFEVYQHKLELILVVEDYNFKIGALSEKFVEEIYRQLPIKSRKELSVNGTEMIKILNLDKGGPIVGEWIQRIEKLVVTNNLENNYESIKKYVRTTDK